MVCCAFVGLMSPGLEARSRNLSVCGVPLVATWDWGDARTFVGFFGGLVDDGAVLEAAEIEHADAAVGAAADEDVDAVGAEADVEHFFVVGD